MRKPCSTPCSAFERRIVHKALSELKGITTYSEGEESREPLRPDCAGGVGGEGYSGIQASGTRPNT